MKAGIAIVRFHPYRSYKWKRTYLNLVSTNPSRRAADAYRRRASKARALISSLVLIRNACHFVNDIT